MTHTVAATQDEMRRHNVGRLLRLLHVRGPTSRAGLTALTGLNRSTVRAITTDLVNAGLVCESAPVGQGRAGRPSIVVEPASARTFALALDIGVDHIVAARIGLGGVVVARTELRHVSADHSVDGVLERAHGLLDMLLAESPAGAVCVGVGVGVCGVVGAQDGSVRFSPNLGWTDVPLGRMLAERLGGLPVVVGNDGDLGAMAEHARGAAAGMSDVIYISGEVGVGGGIIVGGRPLRGAGGYGGEIGHMSVNPRGRTCRCGRRGCWETEIGEEAVLLATGAGSDAAWAEVLAARADADRRAAAGLRRVGRWLGVGVANLVNIFNPEVIVFGGDIRSVFSATEPIVREALTTALEAPREQVRLELAALGADSVVIGAAELAFAPLLDNPLPAETAHAHVDQGRL
jgi:predicted NBD/HSP70 family sugar kinase